MRPTVQGLIDAGWLDRITARLAARGVQSIRGTERWYRDARRDMRAAAGIPLTGAGGAWERVFEIARESANAASRLQRSGGDLPAPAAIPSQTGGGARGGTTTEVLVVVELRDPLTGATNRLLVVVDSATGLSRERLDTLAAAAALDPANWRDSGVRGDVDPSQVRVVDVTIIGVTAR